jgi:hypothetical protein
MEVYSQLNVKMRRGFVEALMKRRKIDYRKDDRSETVEGICKDLNRNRRSTVLDDHGGKFRMGTGEKGLIEVDFQERRRNRSSNSTFGSNEPMSKKVAPGEKFVYGIKKSEKRR